MEDLKPFETKSKDAELVIIELFGGDNNLSHFVYEDLQEMAAGIDGPIVVLGIADLANKPASVVEVGKGTGIVTLEEWGEIDTGDPEVLCRFLTRALMTFPKARKALGFWDHGTGVFDETDATEKLLSRSVHSVQRVDRSRSFPARRLFFSKASLVEDPLTRGMLHDDTNGGVLTNLEASHMIATAFKAAGVTEPIDLIFSDTCLNGMIEVLEQLGPFAKCVVGSPELEPGDGWDYQKWLSLVSKSATRSPDDLGKAAVDAFIEGYKPFPNKYPCTLAAFRGQNDITAAFAELIKSSRRDGGYDTMFFLDHARAKSQDFAKRDTYDLRNFAERVVTISDSKPDLTKAARDLIAAIDAARIHNGTLGDTVTNSTGLAFWFPSSSSALRRDIKTYEHLDFAKKSGWSDFLKEFR